MMLFSLLFAQMASAAPLIAPAINSSRVVPGTKVTDERTAQLIRAVKVIGVSDGKGPQSELFVEGAVEALNDPHQGIYRSVADVSAGLVDGVGAIAGVATGIVSNLTALPGAKFIPGLNKVGAIAGDAVEGVTGSVADKLDGVNRHPDEGFGVVQTEPTVQDRIREGAERVAGRENVLDKAASVAGAAGVWQVQEALNAGETAATVTAAFFRAGVAGNSPDYSGVVLPIRAVAGASGEAQLSATTSVNDLGTEDYKKKVKRKKRDADGNVIKDKDGNPVWETVEVTCTRRTVHVTVSSALRSAGGAEVMSDRLDSKPSDEACGNDRAKELKSASEIAAPIIAGAGRSWGSFVQPQMQTLRLKFNPSGSTALAVDHVMNNRHGAAMCLIQDALKAEPNDAFAKYSEAVLLEAWGRYADAAPLYAAAEAHEAFSKGRWDNGAGRVRAREGDLELLTLAYGMVAKPTAFPYAEACPAIDRSGTVAVLKRGPIGAGAGREDGRRLYEGELLKVLDEVDGKWTKVQQLDGSVGWVMSKRVFKGGE